MIVQRYIKPLLLWGHKWDMRLYVVVTVDASFHRKSIWLSRSGLARFCTHSYDLSSPQSLKDQRAHLSNSALNFSPMGLMESSSIPLKEMQAAFGSLGSPPKWTLSSVLSFLHIQHLIDLPLFWQQIERIVLDTLLPLVPLLGESWLISADPPSPFSTTPLSSLSSVLPNSASLKAADREPIPKRCTEYSSLYCSQFEILGFDIILNNLQQPMLLEVNAFPNLICDCQVDEIVKRQLISDVSRVLESHILSYSMDGDEERNKSASLAPTDQRDNDQTRKQIGELECLFCGVSPDRLDDRIGCNEEIEDSVILVSPLPESKDTNASLSPSLLSFFGKTG